ncbi:MAG: CBS domain-containing protein [Cyclobacteriaceae bacterium]
MIPPLRPTDDVGKVLKWMEKLRVNQLPILDEDNFQGFITEESIYNLKQVYDHVNKYELSGSDCVVRGNQHYYDVVRMAYENQSSLVAVQDDNEYLGVISVQDVIEAYAQTSSASVPGGIIEISLKQIDYSLSEISRLIESEDAKILSSYIATDFADTSKLKLTLKLNTEELSHIVATLSRFGYSISDQYSEKNEEDGEKERLEMLMKYLNLS